MAALAGQDGSFAKAGAPPEVRSLPLGSALAAERRLASAVRALACETALQTGISLERAKAHMAATVSVLWSRVLKHDAADPGWADRDRFVLSAGAGALLVASLLHLTGHAPPPITPDPASTPPAIVAPLGAPRVAPLVAPLGAPLAGVETIAGLAGQGLAASVGLALGERMMAARFGRSLVDHRTWVLADGADFAAGVGQEAIEAAGQMRLDKLAVLYDAEADSAEDAGRRAQAAGWAVKLVDGGDTLAVGAALSFALRSRKPTLIACRRGLLPDPAAEYVGAHDGVPFDVGARGAAARRAWLKRLARHPLRPDFERTLAARAPESLAEICTTLRADFADGHAPRTGTAEAAAATVACLAQANPDIVGCAALPDGDGGMLHRAAPRRAVGFGGRVHGMAAALGGLALHGGLVAFGEAKLDSADLLRPALRQAAAMGMRVVLALTEEEAPAAPPWEQLAALRVIPDLYMFRPADGVETAECCELAVRRTDGPSVLALSRLRLGALRADPGENRSSRGGYVLAEADGPRRATLIASGPEVALAMAARTALAAEGIAVAVVSLPCWELFALQDAAYQATVLGGAPRLGVEAGCGFGWARWLGAEGVFLGGAAAPAEGSVAGTISVSALPGVARDPYRSFAMTPEVVINAVKNIIA
jgi:transketolase